MREDELFALLEGRITTKILVCRLDRAIARAIGANTDAVYLSHYTITKQYQHHKEIRHEHYLMLPIAVAHGRVLQDHERTCMALYSDVTVFGRNFKAALKCVAGTHEIFVSSFHKVEDRKVRAWSKRYPTIRPHWT